MNEIRSSQAAGLAPRETASEGEPGALYALCVSSATSSTVNKHGGGAGADEGPGEHCASVAPPHIIPGGYEVRVNRPHLSLRNCQFDAVVLPACGAIRHVHRGTGCDGLRARPREARASLARATRRGFVFGVCLISASQGYD